MKTIKRYYRVERHNIGYLRFIIEAYDGIAVMRTIDAKSGIIVLHIPPDCLCDAENLMNDMKKNIMMESLTDLEYR